MGRTSLSRRALLGALAAGGTLLPCMAQATESVFIPEPCVSYSASVTHSGWSPVAKDGMTCGWGRQIEGMRANLNVAPLECGISYRVYMQGVGWQDWVCDGEAAGLPEEGKRLEAFQARLRGLSSQDYCLWYRASVDGIGWLDWASDGKGVGTTGMGKPVTAIEMRVLPKDAEAPGETARPFIDNSVFHDLDTAQVGEGVCGFGGYEPSKKARKQLEEAIKGIRDRGFDLGFFAMDLESHEGVAYNCDTKFYGASSIKAPYIASVLDGHPEALRKFEQDIRDTLEFSWDDTYKNVVRAYGTEPFFAWCDELGVDTVHEFFSVDIPWAGYTPRHFAKLWVRIYQLFQDSEEGEIFGTWSEYPETSTIHATLGDKWRTRSKAGWIVTTDAGWGFWNATDDGGIVYADNGAYVVAIMSSVPADFTVLPELTAAIDAAHSEMSNETEGILP